MPNILLIDDDLTSQEILTDILEYAGAQVDSAASGEDGLRLVESDSYDGIIIDLRLPDMDGWQVFEAIQQMTDTPCVAITVYDNVEVRQETRRVGFAGYFPKPVDELSFGQEFLNII